MKFTRADFPAKFVFGAATSAYQIEGHSFGRAGSTHWDTFATGPGNVVRAENGAIACDHYHRWEDDLDLLKAAGFDSYRFSTSWARILPDGVGTPNEAGLDFYDRLVDGCLERGLRPALTLYHWELPSALADQGGWVNADIPNWFAEFAQVVAKRLGDRVWSIGTINEPWCVSILSHLMGHHAPGLRDLRAAARATHHVLKSHGRAVAALRAMGQDNLGISCNFEPAQPATDTPENIAAAARANAIYSDLFVTPLFHGHYPKLAMEGLGPHLPDGWENDFDEIRTPIDWLGVQYYTRAIVADAPDVPWPSVAPVEGPLPKTQMDWEIYPDGLYDLLTWLAREHSGALPLYVTENGMANDDEVLNRAVNDHVRADYIDAHLAAARRAIADGAPLAGYFAWSLLDNYEWAFGYEKRFGLVHVDFETLQRTPKASYHALAAALTAET
ncbi:MAG: beta-glucosidase [Rhodobacteraceae bacterium]|nr:beta-glucosidase [Paracoccaceae bacterium]